MLLCTTQIRKSQIIFSDLFHVQQLMTRKYNLYVQRKVTINFLWITVSSPYTVHLGFRLTAYFHIYRTGRSKKNRVSHSDSIQRLAMRIRGENWKFNTGKADQHIRSSSVKEIGEIDILLLCTRVWCVYSSSRKYLTDSKDTCNFLSGQTVHHFAA